MTASAEYPKAVVLADGRHLELRALADDDALLAVGAFDGERRAGGLRLVAVVPGTAEVQVALDAAYRGVRLGTWLLLDAIHAATGLGLDRLVAEADGDAERATALAHFDFVSRDETSRLVKVLHRGWPWF